jgi:hypothetical protein
VNLEDRRTLRWSWLAPLALATGIVACNNSDHHTTRDAKATPASSSTTTAQPTTTTSAADPHAAVIDSYLAYWRVVNTYGAETGPFDPADFKTRFAPVATGAQYDSLFNVFQLDRSKGWVYRGRENAQYRPRVTEMSGDRAVLEDCADDFGGIFDTRQNAFVEPLTPGQHTKVVAVLDRVDGVWKVSTQGGGDTRCAP